MNYAYGTRLDPDTGPFSLGFVGGRAICSDGKVRALRFTDGIADTFFSIPARVNVGRRTVSGFVTTETAEGWSTETDGDPAVVKFIANQYGRNADALPRGAWKSPSLERTP
jgi:hypothetical protein